MVQTYTFSPKGTWSVRMQFQIEDKDDTIVDFQVMGGCPGNLQGIRRLIIGMKASDVASKLEGVKCGAKPTSCPDQLALGLKSYLEMRKQA